MNKEEDVEMEEEDEVFRVKSSECKNVLRRLFMRAHVKKHNYFCAVRRSGAITKAFPSKDLLAQYVYVKYAALWFSELNTVNDDGEPEPLRKKLA